MKSRACSGLLAGSLLNELIDDVVVNKSSVVVTAVLVVPAFMVSVFVVVVTVAVADADAFSLSLKFYTQNIWYLIEIMMFMKIKYFLIHLFQLIYLMQ